MSDYSLYGTTLIENDNTLKDFSTCVYTNCPMEAIMEDGEERKDFIMELVEGSLQDDISRTNINYVDLMYKYRDEIGDLLYQLDNNGIEIPVLSFFGEGAKECFNRLVYYYIDMHYDEFIKGM